MRTAVGSLVLLASLGAPSLLGSGVTEQRTMGPQIPRSGPALIPNLSLKFAKTTGAEKRPETREDPAYWKARLEWEKGIAVETPPAEMKRAIAETVYRERLARRGPDGRPQPMANQGWRSLGPTTDAGRVRMYHFTPDGSKLYVATGGGGLWMLTRQGGPGSDYGSPVNLTDDLPLLTLGAVAVAPSSPSTVYLATGEQSPISGSLVDGFGVLKSTNGGTSWSFNTQQVQGGVSDLVPSYYSYDLNVHPSNPNDVLLATANGIFRSTDGGVRWANKLPATQQGNRQGCNLQRRPDAPNTIWAALWGGLAYSQDAGETWNVLFEDIAQQVGYPGNPIRSVVGMSRSNPNRLYWIVAGETQQGYSQVGVFRSDDGGANWGTALGPPSGQGYPSIAGEQGWTYLALAVDPTNPDRVYAGGLDMWRSDDAGLSWTQISQWTLAERHPQFCHADINVVTFEPGSATFWVGSDGGLFRSTDNGRTFAWKNDGVVVRMFSSLAQHPTDAYRLYAGTQDNGTMRLNGNSTSAWQRIFYGDGYDCAVNYQSPNIVYATNFSNYTSRADDGGEGENSFRLTNCPANAQDLSQCSLPPVTSFRSRLGMDPQDPRILYAMTDRIYRTTNGASDYTDWQPVFAQYFCADGPSDTSCPQVQKQYASCSNIAVNPADGRRVAFGTQAGYLVVTTDGFNTAQTVSIGAPVTGLAWDPRDTNALYIGLGGAIELLSGQGAHTLYKLNVGGGSVTGSVADSGIGVPITYAGQSRTYYAPVDAIAVSPTTAGLMFAGTKYGIFRSTNGGSSWSYFGDDFPAAWVSALLFSRDGTKLRAATWGRGMWEINPQGGSTGPSTTPTAAFTYEPTTPRPGQAVQFRESSSGGASTWSWTFGDGQSSSEQNPEHVFTNPGTYQVRLTVSNSIGSSSATKNVTVSYGDTGTGDAYTYLIPVVLTSSGAGGAYYTTELTLTNRSSSTLNLTFKATGNKGSSFSGTSTYSLARGQEVRPDIWAFLRNSTGMSVPSGNLVASLRIEVRGAQNVSQFGAQVRVTTPATPDLRAQGVKGAFGLSFPAIRLGTAAKNEAYIYGLQQTSAAGTRGTRSNLACVHAGGGSGGRLTLQVTYTNGDTGQAHASKDTFELDAFQWDQRATPLASRGMTNGFARIQRVSGNDQFLCYGVLNDNLNSDGAFVPMLATDVASETPDAVIPVILDVAGYKSEMTFANRTSRTISGLFALLPSGDPVPDWGYFELEAGGQLVVPDIVGELRSLGFNAPSGTVASVVFQFLDGEFHDGQSDTQARIPTSDGFIGVRTYAQQAGGLFGLAYGYSPVGTAADTEAYVYGLQQTGTRGEEGGTRSNLAIVHALGGSIRPITLEITYYGPQNQTLGSTQKTLQPGQWYQVNGPLEAYPGVTNGYARVRRISGDDQFIAYGVLNDQANNDGSYVPMVIP